MKKAISILFTGVSSIVLLLILSSCPNPISKLMLNRVKDEKLPVIRIIAPAAESYCANVVEVVGEVTDTSTGSGEAGEIRTLRYEVAGTTVSGEVSVAEGGSFAFQFSTTTLSSNFTLSLIATDWNNNDTASLLPLRKMADNSIPYFAAVSGNRQVSLSWPPVPKTKNYTLYYTTNGSLPSENTGDRIDNVTSPYPLSNLTNGSMHVFRLKAEPEPGWPESWSDYLKAIPLSERSIDLRAVGEFKQTRIEWDTIAATGTFEVFRSIGWNGTYSNLSGPIARNDFTDTGVEDGSWYFYKVKPYLAGGMTSCAVAVQTDPFPLTFPSYTSTCNTPDYATEVTVSGGYAYVAGRDSGFQIIDVSDPAKSRLIGSCDTPGSAEAVAVSGGYAYVADTGGGLKVIAIANPSAPAIVASWSTGGDARGVAVTGSYAYVAASGAGLHVVDISNPLNPTAVGVCNTDGSAQDVVIGTGYAYVADFAAGLAVVDISNPQNPMLKVTRGTLGTAYSVAVRGNYAYIANGDSGLQIIDITTPLNPILKGSCGTTNTAFGVAARGSYAFVGAHNSGLHVIDVSDPLAPVIKFTYNTPGQAMDVFLAGDHAFVADYGPGIQILNIANPRWPAQTGYYGPFDIYSLAVRGDYAYAPVGSSQFGVVDLSNPSSPSLIGACAVSDWINDVAVSGDYAFVAAHWASGLKVIDVSDPQAPSLVLEMEMPDHCEGIAVSGDYAYLATSLEGLLVVDISNPTSPVIAGTCATTFAQDVAVMGAYAYVADYTAGLRVIDISIPAAPVIVGSTLAMVDARGVFVSGDYAYVADDAAGLRVVRISNPAAPVILSTCDTPGRALDVVVRGRFAYVADKNWGLQVVDVSNPALPVIVGAYITSGWASGIALGGYYAYIADDSGLGVINLFPE